LNVRRLLESGAKIGCLWTAKRLNLKACMVLLLPLTPYRFTVSELRDGVRGQGRDVEETLAAVIDIKEDTADIAVILQQLEGLRSLLAGKG
jgi:hypothetical protein